MQLLRIKNFFIGVGELLFGHNIILSSILGAKSSRLINQVFPEVGHPFRKWANFLAIDHVSLLVLVL